MHYKNLIMSFVVLNLLLCIFAVAGPKENCESKMSTMFSDIVDERGQDAIGTDCETYAEFIGDTVKDFGLGSLLIIGPQVEACYKLVRSARDSDGTDLTVLSSPVNICINIINQEKDCIKTREAEGKETLTCLIVTGALSDVFKKHPEYLSETVQLSDVIKLDMMEKCTNGGVEHFPQHYASTDDEDLNEECSDYADYLIDVVAEEGFGAVLGQVTKVNLCLVFLKANANVTSPILFCKNLMQEEKKCKDEFGDVAKCKFEELVKPAFESKCFNDVKRHLPLIAEKIGDDAIKAECSTYINFLDKVKSDYGQAGVFFVHWQMAECVKKASIGVAAGHLDVDNPISMCAHLIKKEKECVDEFKKEEKRDHGVCFFLTALAGKTISEYPQILEEDTKLEDILAIGLVHECSHKIKTDLPSTFANIGEEQTVLHCVDYVEFLIDTVKTYGITSLPLVKDRMDACFRFMVRHTDVENPILTCKTSIMEQRKCVDEKVQQGHPDPLGVCDKIAVKKAIKIALNPELAKHIPQTLPKARQLALNRFINRHSSLKDLLDQLSQEQKEVFMHLDRARQKKILEKGIDKAAKELKKYKVKKVKRADKFRKRVVKKVTRQKIIKTYNTLRRRYLAAKIKLTGAKIQFNKYKLKEKQCAGKDTPECEEMRKKAKAHAKIFLNRLAENTILHLQQVKEKIKLSDDLTEEMVAEITSTIDKEIKFLETAKGDLDIAETKKEIKSAGKEIITISKRVHKQGAIYLYNVIVSHVADILNRADDLESQLNTIVHNLEESGADVSSIDLQIETFSLHIDTAREKFKLADKYFKEAYSYRENNEKLGDALSLVIKGKSLVNEAKKELRTAETEVKKITKEIKKAGGSVVLNLSDDAEETVVEEIEIEVNV